MFYACCVFTLVSRVYAHCSGCFGQVLELGDLDSRAMMAAAAGAGAQPTWLFFPVFFIT